MTSRRTRQRPGPKFADDPEVKRAIEQIAECYIQHEVVSSQIRRHVSQAALEDAYHAASVEWKQGDYPNAFPMGDLDAQAKFLENCRALMQSNPTTTKEYSVLHDIKFHANYQLFLNSRLLVTFACHARRVGLTMQTDSHPAHRYIMVEVNKRVLKDIPKLCAQANQPVQPMPSELPLQVANAVYPADMEDIPTTRASEEVGPFLVGKSFESYDSRNGTTTCRVHDCGTSYLLGDWFSVSISSNEQTPTTITKSEMTELWKARKTEPEVSGDGM
ncbi:hypothetical protein F5I97DRAFT_1914226 [Phlebopus sp. FC_14]|nr:hypothetical protein F5I97DRAFT_1914226 [Phlebopus sp. FC_14]